MDNNDVVNFLNSLDGASEAQLVTTFEVYFDHESVTVRVCDYGARAGKQRYAVESFYTSEGPSGESYGRSNKEPSISEALGNARFHRF